MEQNRVLDVLTSKELTYEQKVFSLAREAEDSLEVLDIPPKTRAYFETGALNDLFEGHAPYRPRYIMPDYKKFVRQGSKFLRIEPPKTLDELLTGLEILYHHVPSITGFPVYLGELDTMIEPFTTGLADDEVKEKIRLFLIYLDRTITDSFCHGNLGAKPTRTGRIILELEKELQNAVPNLTLKYDPDVTPDEYAELAVSTSLYCANPAICNDADNRTTYPCEYGISSCYNILPVGGGAYTLSRITLTELVKSAKSTEHFLKELLPDCLNAVGNYMNERVKFLVERSGFFESSFLVREGLIEREKFVGMFGVTGLAECVNALMADTGKRYGHSAESDDLGVQIMEIIQKFVADFPAVYSEIGRGHYLLHAQVGLDSDKGITSGVRIPVGDEPENLLDHLRHSARFHEYFPTGVGDIFPFAVTARNNPGALVDIVKGSFQFGVKYMSFYASDSDLVRITGFLVKRSEMEKYRNHDVVLQNTTVLGSKNYDTNHLELRKERMA